jgi:hypothetical protein
MNKSVLIVGGGFRSLIAAIGYSRQGFKVVIVEKSKKLGGFMSPIPWKNYWLDKGPQYFDNFSKDDLEFMEDLIGKNKLTDIDFKYSTFMDGNKTDGFAIPDWRCKGNEFCVDVFDEIIKNLYLSENNSETKANKNLLHYLTTSFGKKLGRELDEICKKMLTVSSIELSIEALKMVTFGGRALLFNEEKSKILKTSPLLDDCIAVQKKSSGSNQYNLYPFGSNLESIRIELDKAIKNSEINVIYDSSIEKICPQKKSVSISGKDFHFDQIFLGIDCRDAEEILLGTKNLLNETTIVPEIFHFIELKENYKSDSYYTMNYSQKHRVSRVTNFHNYLGNDGKLVPVLCAEEPISIERFKKQKKEMKTSEIVLEVCEMEGINPSFIKDTKSYFIPTTYKVPKFNFDNAELKFRNKVTEKYEDYCIIPSLTTLTRKQTLDDLRGLNII